MAVRRELLADSLLGSEPSEAGQASYHAAEQQAVMHNRLRGLAFSLTACMLVCVALLQLPDGTSSIRHPVVTSTLALADEGGASSVPFSIPRKCIFAMLVGAGVGVFGTLLAGPVLALFGFTSAGVTAGSLAALWQSSMGSVAAGSLFAVLQSVAAAGLGFTGAVVVTGSTATAAITFCKGLDSICGGCIGS
jgi:hypothetical protein